MWMYSHFKLQNLQHALIFPQFYLSKIEGLANGLPSMLASLLHQHWRSVAHIVKARNVTVACFLDGNL